MTGGKEKKRINNNHFNLHRGPPPRANMSQQMVRARFHVICVDPSPEETLEPIKLNTFTIEAAFSWTVRDLIAHVEHHVGRRVSAMFASGKLMDPDDLAVTYPVRTLTFTTTEAVGFRVVEAAGLETLYDRGEGYRLVPVARSLKKINSYCTEGSKAMRASSGSGGVYFLKPNTIGSDILACFKPRDEEPGSRNNPSTASVREGVLPGEAAEREVASFILDWGGFCGVPPTVLVEAACDTFNPGPRRPLKVGSFQHFVQNASDTVGDYSPHLFPAREVHKIGILDLRLLNMDRNDSNILVVRNGSEYKLIPIDHGLCFPDKIEVGWCDWVWWDWPQTLIPFDEETREWVMSLDISEDLNVLERCFNLRPECLRIYRCMVTLLKKGVAAGLNLRDIASVVIRSGDIDEPSAFEKTITRANELAALMESNSRVLSEDDHSPRRRLHRSSSFDGNLHSLSISTRVSDDLFFSYVDRLLEDVVDEVLRRKVATVGHPVVSLGSWFSASSRSSPSELTKIASPRLASMRLYSASSNGTKSLLSQSIPTIPALSLHQ